ncbi:type IV secretory system conjugative DNA transfer family protein [Actinoplanes missouriensis]|nr:type IV secretory system conjugative DNA transfer family protein [Actinoplanes missouriensis]
MRGDDETFRISLGDREGERVRAEPFGPALVLGPHRSRKTTGVVVPALLEWPGPALVTSIREDVIEQTLEARRRHGEVMIIDPGGVLEEWPDRVGWSPLDFIASWDDAMLTARIMVDAGHRRGGVNENHWTEAAIRLLAPFLYAAARGDRTMADVMRWIGTQAEDEAAAIIEGLGDDEGAEVAKVTLTRDEQQRAVVYLSLEVAIAVWHFSSVQNLADAEPRFQMSKFLNGRNNTVYVCAPPNAQHEFRPYFTTFIPLFVRSVYRANRGFASSLLDLRGPVAALEESESPVKPLLMALDDAGSVAPIPDLGGLVSTASKAAIQLITVCTDVSQLRSVYGENLARSIVNNHSSVLVLPGGHDTATAELSEQLLGSARPAGLPAARTSAEALRILPRGRALCVTGTAPPEIIELRSSVADPDLLALRGVTDGDY